MDVTARKIYIIHTLLQLWISCCRQPWTCLQNLAFLLSTFCQPIHILPVLVPRWTGMSRQCQNMQGFFVLPSVFHTIQWNSKHQESANNVNICCNLKIYYIWVRLLDQHRNQYKTIYGRARFELVTQTFWLSQRMKPVVTLLIRYTNNNKLNKSRSTTSVLLSVYAPWLQTHRQTL